MMVGDMRLCWWAGRGPKVREGLEMRLSPVPARRRARLHGAYLQLPRGDAAAVDPVEL
jgi:hypothetical protein